MNFIEKHQLYKKKLSATLNKIEDINLAKKRLSYLRWKVSENLDKLLFEFETNVKKTDANVLFAPTIETAIEHLNKHLKPFSKVNFLEHNAIKKMVANGNIVVPENSEKPDVVIVGAKFLMANTGNIFIALNNVQEYQQIINAKKTIIIAGIDSILASQIDLPLAKQLYSTYEIGELIYPAEILTRPGKPRGLQTEIVLILIDNGRSKLLTNPFHRPLFNLLNFDLAPVCPMHQISEEIPYWKNIDSLSYFLNPFTTGLDAIKQPIFGNYGFEILNQYLPYDIDLSEHVTEARSFSNQNEKKKTVFNSFLDTDKSSIALNAKNFRDKEKFKKYAMHNFFGK